jgi:hypothetical protein
LLGSKRESTRSTWGYRQHIDVTVQEGVTMTDIIIKVVDLDDCG